MNTPQVGDVWVWRGHRRHVTAVSENYVEYDYRDILGAQLGDCYRLQPRFFVGESKLIERNGEAVQ